MNINQWIAELRDRRNVIDRAIAVLSPLERSEAAPGPRPRRGRKSMDSAERQVVSERMSKYWAKQRKIKARVEEIAK